MEVTKNVWTRIKGIWYALTRRVYAVGTASTPYVSGRCADANVTTREREREHVQLTNALETWKRDNVLTPQKQELMLAALGLTRMPFREYAIPLKRAGEPFKTVEAGRKARATTPLLDINHDW